tara:strand:+ start:1217 stop:1603 length:387 start_codon:yes stop_codon:yes gene_type:complete
MATQIVISNNDYIKVDNSFQIDWADKGNAMPAISNTIHAVIWNTLPGSNEIQSKDSSTGNMTGNTSLSATSDAVGSTTIADLLVWGDIRKLQIEEAQTAFVNAKADDDSNGTTNTVDKSWIDYDPHYS